MIGLGITTYNRPEFFAQAVKSAVDSGPDYLVIYNDGSKENYDEIYSKIEEKTHIIHNKENKGVAKAKNILLKTLLDNGCDHLFLMEDDIIVKSPKVFQAYLQASEKSGWQHFNFAHHGPANNSGPLYSDAVVSYFPHCVGAFSYYSRESIETVGYMDENFHNAWEHVEHTKRLGDAGFTSPWGAFVDMKDSKDYLTEIPESIEKSSIRPRKDWNENITKGLEYWREKDPNCPL